MCIKVQASLLITEECPATPDKRQRQVVGESWLQHATALQAQNVRQQRLHYAPRDAAACDKALCRELQSFLEASVQPRKPK